MEGEEENGSFPPADSLLGAILNANQSRMGARESKPTSDRRARHACPFTLAARYTCSHGGPTRLTLKIKPNYNPTCKEESDLII